MRIVFVRHGHPNYANDCLTELGHVHAEAAAERLMGEGIGEIHASSCGRAVETAQHTASRLGLEIVQHDFIREIGWGSTDGSELLHNGHPWLVAEDLTQKGMDLTRADWRETEPFCRNRVVQCVDHVGEGTDRWLAALGYARDGRLYRVTRSDTDRTVAMFSHAGSSSAALAQMFNLPFPYVCATLAPDFTAITVVTLSDEPGALTMPRFEIANDARHIRRGELVISN